MEQKTVQAIILSKLRYGDDSLIISALSPNEGQLKFIHRYALRQSKTKFPAIDLFREVEICFKENSRSELLTLLSAELVEAHDRIAMYPQYYRKALWLSKFISKNTVAQEPCQHLYNAIRVFYQRLDQEKPKDCLPLLFPVLLTFLAESGQLPDLSSNPAKESAMLQVLGLAQGATVAPDYDLKQWHALYEWIISFMTDLDLDIPRE